MEFLFSVLILSFYMCIKAVEGTGYMSTIATSGDPEGVTTSAVCVLQNKTLVPDCEGYSDPNVLPGPPKKSMFAISGGRYFFCGLIYDSGKPACWGQHNTSAVEIPQDYNDTVYSSLNTGSYHVCAIRKDNKQVNCWGGGNGKMQNLPTIRLISVTSGYTFSCGLKELSKSVTCWGNGAKSDWSATHGSRTFDAIFAGNNHVCGIESGSENITCWGDNSSGQTNPPQGMNFSALSAGANHTCGLRKDTEGVYCWGSLKNVEFTGKFSIISSASNYACAVQKDTGTVVCKGSTRTENDYPAYANEALCAQECLSDQQLQECNSSASKQECPNTSDKLCFQYATCANQTTRTPVSNPNSTSGVSSSSSSIKKGFIVGIALACGFGVIFIIFLLRLCLCPTRAKSKTEGWRLQANRVVQFSSSQLKLACNNYSEEMIVGKGAFGMVYKGILPNGQNVAIKKAAHLTTLASLTTELQLLARVHHVNLVNLVGYCEEEGLLVYEFMEKGSLFDCLFDKEKAVNLDWHKRIKIATQAARGLEYLHIYASPRIIHRDVKSSNILLDAAWNAFVSDFGLSVLLPPPNEGHYHSGHLAGMPIAGTQGYLDPEYFQTMDLTLKSDVYSFGVVLLELLTGLKAVMVVAWTSNMLQSDVTMINMLDRSLECAPNPEALLKAMDLGLRCVRRKGKDRPSMSYVANKLEGILGELQILSCRVPQQQAMFQSSDSSLLSSTSVISSYEGGSSSTEMMYRKN